jgi:hypothetical protein
MILVYQDPKPEKISHILLLLIQHGMIHSKFMRILQGNSKSFSISLLSHFLFINFLIEKMFSKKEK